MSGRTKLHNKPARRTNERVSAVRFGKRRLKKTGSVYKRNSEVWIYARNSRLPSIFYQKSDVDLFGSDLGANQEHYKKLIKIA